MIEAWAGTDPRDRGRQGTGPQTVDFAGPAWNRRRTPSPHAQFALEGRNTRCVTAEWPYSGTERRKPSVPDQKRVASSTAKVESSAATGATLWDVTKNPPVTYTNVRAVVTSPMEPRSAIAHRRLHPRTPLIAEQWRRELRKAYLHTKYPQIFEYILHGAHAGIPKLLQSYTPFNKLSTETSRDIFNEMIQAEFSKGRDLGPFSRDALKAEIGPFQSSPLSLVPKAGVRATLPLTLLVS